MTPIRNEGSVQSPVPIEIRKQKTRSQRREEGEGEIEAPQVLMTVMTTSQRGAVNGILPKSMSTLLLLSYFIFAQRILQSK